MSELNKQTEFLFAHLEDLREDAEKGSGYRREAEAGARECGAVTRMPTEREFTFCPIT